MLQGTSSHVGKSVLATAFCRIIRQDGYSVAPFKSQNMSNNSGVTFEGGEMGRAQWVQAEAAGVTPSVLMNPILIKPKGDMHSQVVFMGRPLGDFEAGKYHREFTRSALPVVKECLDTLLERHDALVIEGAGSPAEVNLKAGDIVNMRVAKLAEAPVLLVADIDRGGVFAHIVGTLELLDDDERELVAGFIINKFRGNKGLLDPGLDFLEKRTGRPVLGVVPYIHGHDIPDEDAVCIEMNENSEPAHRLPGEARIAVIHLPRISNFTDFEPLARARGLKLDYISRPQDLSTADCIIIPGTKNTVLDMEWMRRTGIAAEVVRRSREVPVIGICGGYQMLGRRLLDPGGSEGAPGEYEGLGLLDATTTFGPEKTTTRSTGRVTGSTSLLPQGEEISGYEIHAGVTRRGASARPLIEVLARDGVDKSLEDPMDGAVSSDGQIIGTYFHGLFDNRAVLQAFLGAVRGPERGCEQPCDQGLTDARQVREVAYERLASLVREHVDIPSIYAIMGLHR